MKNRLPLGLWAVLFSSWSCGGDATLGGIDQRDGGAVDAREPDTSDAAPTDVGAEPPIGDGAVPKPDAFVDGGGGEGEYAVACVEHCRSLSSAGFAEFAAGFCASGQLAGACPACAADFCGAELAPTVSSACALCLDPITHDQSNLGAILAMCASPECSAVVHDCLLSC